MKDAKQFSFDFKENEELRRQFQEEMNRLRTDETLEAWQAGQKAALSLGYEIGDEDAKQFMIRTQKNSENDSEELSDDEVLHVAGGMCSGDVNTVTSYGSCVCSW